MPCDQWFDQSAQSRHQRQHETQIGPQAGEQGRRGHECRRDRFDLGAAAAGQHRDHRLRAIEAEGGTRGAARHGKVDRIGQRMADIRGGDAMLLQQRGLEREQAEHMVGAARDLGRAAGAPGPDRRADEVDRLDAGVAQLVLETEIEVGRIDTDEGVGLVGDEALEQRIADALDLAVVAQHLDIAAHRQLVVWPPGGKAMLGHARAADAEGLQRRPALLQAAEQQAGEQVARSLAGDQRDDRI